MMPPCNYSNPFQAQFSMGANFPRENPLFSTPRVLNAISDALNKSLRNYE